LTGNIPNFKQDTMSFINLSKNFLSGSIPSPLLNLPQLEFLYLNDNRLGSSIPTSFGMSGRLKDVYLNNNDLSGPIPEVTDFTNINELLLQENNLSGEMPDTICAIRENSSEFINLYVDCSVVCNCCNVCV